WKVALAAIAERLKRIVGTTGPQTILNTHYSGTISLLAFFFPMRFFHRLGATEVTPDTICNMAGHVALNYIYGTSVNGFDPRTARDAACIVVWGANPSASAPHVHEHWLAKAPGKLVVIDPVRTPTAQAADLHLQPFPGSDAALACALLPAATGNLGKPGAGLLYLNFNLAQRHIDDTYLVAPHLCRDTPPRISQMDLAACLEDPARAQALMCWNINIAASNPQQARLREALSREDLFTVVLDLFPTDTTDFADFVLPAASFLEFNDLVAGYFQLTLSAQVKVMDPLGEALPNQEIFRRLAQAMGYTE